MKKIKNNEILFLLGITIVLALTVQYFNRDKLNIKQLSTYVNPLAKEYSTIAKQYDLNLSFTHTVWEQRYGANYLQHPIFSRNKKSLDILLIGDSSIAWGVIPRVIEQMTDKKVAMYAFAANTLTEKTAKLYNKIAKYYLKDNGLIIIAFDDWTLDDEPNSIAIFKKKYNKIMHWSNEEFSNYAQKYKKTLYKDALDAHNKKNHKSKKNKDANIFSYFYYKNKYEKFSNMLKTKYGMYLKSPILYKTYIEAKINPTWSKNKFINENAKTKFLRWDMETITEYNPIFKRKSFHSESMPDKNLSSVNIEKNAYAASKIYGKRKMFLIPLAYTDEEYISSRNIYYSYYQKLGFDICDLGILNPKNVGYTMQGGGTHMGNTGGLMKSILLGKFLKNYYIK